MTKEKLEAKIEECKQRIKPLERMAEDRKPVHFALYEEYGMLKAYMEILAEYQ